jgi:sigma-B regulation protein RsbU (phosphoserine phosphatase)
VDESLRLRAKLEEADAVQEDLRLAHERQRHLLPAEPPSMPNSELSILYRPAGLMGGDFYDFIKLPKDRLGIIVGDVSGHGMEAGILMGMAKKVLNMRLRQYHDPLVTVIRANEDLHAELDRQSFVTAVVAVYDARQYEMKYARAGHVPPYHLRKDEVRRLGAPGPALGLILAGGFERGIQHERVPVQPGDLFLFHTDGVEDVKNRQDEDFGSEQLETVLRSTAGSEAGEILSVLKYAMREFAEGTPHEDDITAVCLKVK